MDKLIIYFWRLFGFGIFLVLFLFVGVETNIAGLFGEMPALDQLENPKHDLPSLVYTSDSVLMAKFYHENREPVNFNDISPNVINALIATEDVRFYDHCGIDLKGFLAIFYTVFQNQQRGGSTITQQLSKNLFKTRSAIGHGLLGKIPGMDVLIYKAKEWITAIKLERFFSKEEILLMYLNTVDYGSNSFGIKAASRSFFDTTPDSLNVEQAAVLIGGLKATTYYHPLLHPDRSLERRNIVLKLMEQQGFISAAGCDSLCKIDLSLKFTYTKSHHPIAEYLQGGALLKFLNDWCRENKKDLYRDGLVIYTTIDSKIQLHAENAVKTHLGQLQKKFFNHWEGQNPWIYKNKTEIPNYLEHAIQRTEIYKKLKNKYGEDEKAISEALSQKSRKRIFSWKGDKDSIMSLYDSLGYYKHFLHAGMMAMDPSTGQIKAWVGGIDYKYFKFDHVIQSRRQPGSAFKPFVYAAALEQGYTPCDLIPDEPILFEYMEKGVKKRWAPRNADWVFTGDSLNLRQALGRSINSVAAHLTRQVGVEDVIRCAHKMGISSPLDTVPSIGLGSSDVSIFEMTGAYSAFVNKGIWIEPHFIDRIEDRNGNILLEYIPEIKEVLDEYTAYTMVHLLKGTVEEAGGTSANLFSFDIFRNNELGGKTGTTSNYSDGWYMGINPHIVTGVWVGAEDRVIHFKTSALGEASKTALPTFGYFLENLYKDPTLNFPKGKFKKPPGYKVELNCPYRPTTEIRESADEAEILQVEDLEDIFEF
ncbi:MAG: transglycosylase domain-containing protein [Cytophagaceae bacterium]